MSTYIQLLRLTPEGSAKMLENSDTVLQAQHSINVPGIQVLGLYAVLGAYDFVNILEAPDNDTVARFSIQMGVIAGVSITTLPAIPVSRLEPSTFQEPPELDAEITLSPPGEALGPA